ncbi:MAG: hypothetical protein CL946_11005 [Ectothiorhodospiraceae bacterium]|nr:hypothetical protein [Ectothiorhodospiraceae bacterium]
MNQQTNGTPFEVKDCALTAIATGKRAQNIKELRQILDDIHPGCLYYHFWGDKLRPKFIDLEYFNDFAYWANSSLHEPKLAERLAVIDPTGYDSLEALRQDVIDILEERLDEIDVPMWTKPDEQFYFIRSQIVVFETQHFIYHPHELAQAIEDMSLSSVFYHFVDARRRTPDHLDDFRAWLRGFDGKYETLVNEISKLDVYFTPLGSLKQNLLGLFRQHV